MRKTSCSWFAFDANEIAIMGTLACNRLLSEKNSSSVYGIWLCACGHRTAAVHGLRPFVHAGHEPKQDRGRRVLLRLCARQSGHASEQPKRIKRRNRMRKRRGPGSGQRRQPRRLRVGRGLPRRGLVMGVAKKRAGERAGDEKFCVLGCLDSNAMPDGQLGPMHP